MTSKLIINFVSTVYRHLRCSKWIPIFDWWTLLEDASPLLAISLKKYVFDDQKQRSPFGEC